MNNAGGNMCRFCLKIIRDQNMDIISEITLEILNVLLIKMDLTIDGNTLMCNQCQENIERCFNFKSMCLYSEDTLVEHITEGSQLDLAEVYLKGNLRSRSKEIPRGHKVCRLCTKITRDAKCLKNTDGTIVLINEELHKYIPEVNLNAVKNPVICETCVLGLQSYYDFATACLDVEKKINRYCEAKQIDQKQVQLYDVLQFILSEPESKRWLKLEDDVKSERIIGNKEDELTNRGQVYCSGAEEFIINRHRNGDKMENILEIDVKQEKLSVTNVIKPSDENQPKPSTKHKDVAESGIKHEAIDIKSEVADMKDDHDGVIRRASIKNTYYCELCTFTTGNKKLFKRHLITHMNPSTIYECEECSFTTKYEIGLKRHRTLVHRNPSIRREFKCRFCPYKNKLMCQVKQHEVTHKHPSERQKLKCTLCPFQCFKKSYLKQHMNLHIVAPEAPWYKCPECSFKTLHSQSIKPHIRNYHDIIPEAELFSCAHCPFKAKTKANLRKHLVSHKDKSEIITFNCNQCPYKGKLRTHLRAHMETHKSPSQIVLNKCEMCPFQCKTKSGLYQHSLCHKRVDELTMFKCLHCSYQTKTKRCLVRHLQTHIDTSLRPKFKCEVCGVEVKSNCALRRHVRVTCAQRSPDTIKVSHKRKNSKML